MRLYGLPTCVLNTSLLVSAAQTVKLVSVSRNCAFYCTPKFITAASGFGGVCHYTLVIEHVRNVLKILSQFVVRKLIGFSGNYNSGLIVVAKPLVKLQILFCGFVARIYDMN